MSKKKYDKMLALYDEVVKLCPRFKRKGKTMPYTSANGYMFTLLNKNAQLGVRFGKDKQKHYIDEWGSDIYKSYDAVMKGYVLVPDSLLSDKKLLSEFMNESFDYVMSLPTK